MRLLWVIAMSTGLAVTMTACSQLDPTPLAATPATRDTPISSAALHLTEPTQAAPKLTPDQTIGLQSTPWELLATENDALVIRYVAGGGCSEWAGVRVDETDSTVEIWTTTRPPKGDAACVLNLAIRESVIPLRKPLGSRTLLHAPVTSDWVAYRGRF